MVLIQFCGNIFLKIWIFSVLDRKSVTGAGKSIIIKVQFLYQSPNMSFICIPHICHFFTQAKFLENKIYTEKRVNYDKLHSKLLILRVNYDKLHSKLPILRVNYDKSHSKLPIFRVKSVKIYTGQFFLHRHRLWCL